MNVWRSSCLEFDSVVKVLDFYHLATLDGAAVSDGPQTAAGINAIAIRNLLDHGN